jgi:hypothetical protein
MVLFLHEILFLLVNTRVTLIQDVLDKRQNKAAGAELYFSYFQPFDDERETVFSVEMLDVQVFIQAFNELLA